MRHVGIEPVVVLRLVSEPDLLELDPRRIVEQAEHDARELNHGGLLHTSSLPTPSSSGSVEA